MWQKISGLHGSHGTWSHAFGALSGIVIDAKEGPFGAETNLSEASQAQFLMGLVNLVQASSPQELRGGIG